MPDHSGDVDRIGLALFRRLFARCAEIARAEITATFGQAWRGGKIQFPYLQDGHGHELTQALNGYDATHAVITVSAGATTGFHHVDFDTARPYVSGATPVVLVSSGDPAWLATWENVDDTGFDLRVTAVPLSVSGEHDVAISAAANSGTQAISFGVTFTAAPVIEVEVVDDPSGTNKECDYQPSILSRSTTGFTAKIVHFPIQSTQSSNNATLTTGMTSPPVVTGGVNGTPNTGASSRTPDTGDQSQGHQHPFTGSPTGDEDRSHHHAMDHDHPVGAHDHNTGDHTHSLNNHHHDVDPFPVEPSTRHLTVGWTATGVLSAAGGDVPVSWLAIGVQQP